MPSDFPLNDKFVRLDGSTGYVTIPDSVSLSGGNRIVATVDVQFDALPGTTRSFFGKAATADFSFTVTSAGIVSFISRRSGGNKTAALSSAQAIVAGRRYVLTGVDDGATVKLYVNGDLGATSVASATGAVVADTTALLIGADTAATNLSALQLWTAQVIRDDLLVLRLYVREEAANVASDGATKYLLDTSGYGNHGTLIGTEGTNYWFASSTQNEPAFPGSSLL